MKEGFPFVLLLALFAFSVTIKANGITSDTLQPQKGPLYSKEKALNAETLIASGKMAGSRLQGPQLIALSLQAMDAGFAPSLQYRLIDTLHQVTAITFCSWGNGTISGIGPGWHRMPGRTNWSILNPYFPAMPKAFYR